MRKIHVACLLIVNITDHQEVKLDEEQEKENEEEEEEEEEDDDDEEDEDEVMETVFSGRD